MKSKVYRLTLRVEWWLLETGAVAFGEINTNNTNTNSTNFQLDGIREKKH